MKLTRKPNALANAHFAALAFTTATAFFGAEAQAEGVLKTTTFERGLS